MSDLKFSHKTSSQPPHDFRRISDLYWGGPDRRITRLTLKIISVNIVALLLLVIGIFYLGQREDFIIDASLSSFQNEATLITNALYSGAYQISVTGDTVSGKVDIDKARAIVKALAAEGWTRIRLFGDDGLLIADSYNMDYESGAIRIANERRQGESLESLALLKDVGRLLLSILPKKDTLPFYREQEIDTVFAHVDTMKAMGGSASISAWQTDDNRIFLTIAIPILAPDQSVFGVTLISRYADDIRRDVATLWLDILKAFVITLVITTLLSIYLSGVIARPLKKLARAVEAIRKGEASKDEIPDMTERNDEIGELSIAMRDMMEALWKRIDNTEKFAADVAHELKNPLTSLRSAMETLSFVKKKADRDRLMAVIIHDIERMDRLITDISYASRLDAELSREKFTKVDLKSLFFAILDTHRTANSRGRIDQKSVDYSVMIENDITIELSLPSSKRFYVAGLEGRLMQVFENLLSNAISFSDKGGSIRITLLESSNDMEVQIDDDGSGVPKANLEDIFDRFYTERPEYEQYGRHSGLGLSICRQIIKAHGGEIFAENRYCDDGSIAGARFTVLLQKA